MTQVHFSLFLFQGDIRFICRASNDVEGRSNLRLAVRARSEAVSPDEEVIIS